MYVCTHVCTPACATLTMSRGAKIVTEALTQKMAGNKLKGSITKHIHKLPHVACACNVDWAVTGQGWSYR